VARSRRARRFGRLGAAWTTERRESSDDRSSAGTWFAPTTDTKRSSSSPNARGTTKTTSTPWWREPCVSPKHAGPEAARDVRREFPPEHQDLPPRGGFPPARRGRFLDEAPRAQELAGVPGLRDAPPGRCGGSPSKTSETCRSPAFSILASNARRISRTRCEPALVAAVRAQDRPRTRIPTSHGHTVPWW
jgi:hypothetical protein